MSTTPTHEAVAEQVIRSLEANVGILHASAQLEVNDEPDPRDEHVRRHLERAAEVVRACAALGRANNPTALGLLARTHLEALIQVLWVTGSTTNADELVDAKADEVVRMARVNMQSGKLRVMNKTTGEDESARFLSDERLKPRRRRRSVESYAEEAGVHDLYNIFYRFLSLETHGHQLEVNADRSDWKLTAMHLQGIGGLTQALGHTGVRWLIHRQKPNNEELRDLLGLPR